VTEVTSPSGGVASFEYDGFGRVTWEEDAAGVVTETAYDALGNVVEEKVNGAVVRTATYDTEGRPLTATKLGTATLSYDGAGRVITRTDERGSGVSKEWGRVHTSRGGTPERRVLGSGGGGAGARRHASVATVRPMTRPARRPRAWW
jgi:YD repeat-containing protein